MNNKNYFAEAEEKLQKPLEEYFRKVFDENRLVSHGLGHHRRVWNYAKELTILLTENNILNYPLIAPKLIIACYFHDTGMTVDSGEKHGKYSRDICEKYLKTNNFPVNDYSDVLSAVQNHDNKEYLTSETLFNLHTILSIADDLDAFGITGIFRYAEIYIKRGISPDIIGFKIKENAARRFNNFRRIFEPFNELVEKHRERYLVIDNFFNEYNKLPDINISTGHQGVMAIIYEHVEKAMGLTAFYNVPPEKLTDPIIGWFIPGLIREIT